MPEKLGESEFEILQDFADAGDRIGYYDQLEDWGYTYGELARGVVTGDQMSGRTANNFFLNRAQEQLKNYNEENGFEKGDAGYADPEITKTDMAELSQALMEADLVVRQIEDGPNRAGERLSVDTVQEYHADAFEAQFSDRLQGGIHIRAWTPYEALQKRETLEAREELWDNMLEEPAAFTAVRTVRGLDYGGDQIGGGAKAFVGREGEVGPYRINSPGQDGEVIAGTGRNGFNFGGNDGTAERPLQGTSRSDVFFTFSGDDHVGAGDGDDRAYLGSGDDSASMGPGNDLASPGSGSDKLDGGADIDFIDYSTNYDLPARRIEMPKSFVEYLFPDSKQTYEFETNIGVVNGETTITTIQPGEIVEPGFPYISEPRSKRDIDTAVDFEGYKGSDISDIVTLNGVSENLYLDGGRHTDTLRLRLPEGVEASAIFDNSPGIVPENGDFGNLPFDSRLSLETGQTVYVINFENMDTGRVQEGFIVEAHKDGDTAPEISITDPNVLSNSGAKEIPAVPLKRAVEMLSEDKAALNDTSNPSEWQITVRDAVNHPDAVQMFQNLHEGGVETIPAEVAPNMAAEIRAPKLLKAGAVASHEAGIPLPEEQREQQAQHLNNINRNPDDAHADLDLSL